MSDPPDVVDPADVPEPAEAEPEPAPGQYWIAHRDDTSWEDTPRKGDRVLVTSTDEGIHIARGKHHFIGADFLQGSKARLDYSRHHNQTFSGVETADLPSIGIGPITRLPVTPAQHRALQHVAGCKRRKARKSR